MTRPGRPRWPLWLSAAAAAAGVVGVAGGVLAARPLIQTPRRRLLSALDLRAGDVLLEIGLSDDGSLARALEVVERAAAIDRSQEVVDATCRENVAELAAGRLDVRLGDADSLPWADGSFTAVAMNQVVIRLPDAARALGEVHRVLRPGGRLAYQRRGLHPHDGEVTRMLEAAGFASVAVESRGLGQYARAVRP